VRLQDHDKAFERAQQTAIDEAKHYLAFRFDTAKLFFDIPAWDPTESYGENVTVSAEADEWKSGEDYQIDDLVEFDREIYVALSANSATEPPGSSDWDKVGQADTLYTTKTDSVTSYPNDTSDWEQKDPRDSQLVKVIVDLLLYELYSLTQPRQIPEYRMSRRDDAKDWLKEANKGNLTLDFPEASPSDDTDQRMQWGGFTSSTRNYQW